MISPNAPYPKQKEVDLLLFADSDHKGDRMARISRHVSIVYMYTALIQLDSKEE